MIAGNTALVTGADGFIGSHLVERLVSEGARVAAMVLYNSWGEIGWLAELPDAVRAEVELVVGDVRDAERMRDLVAGKAYVFHLASLIAIPYSYEAPRSYVETNVLGGLNVLQACRDSDALTRLVHVSTSEVYGTARQVPIPESHPLVGQSPYAASKIAADKLVESFHRSFDLPAVTARPFNTYGPRQTARAVIPTIASQLAAGADTLRLGATWPTRDLNYVTDTADALVALAGCTEADGQAVNIGSGEERSIAQIAALLCEIAGREVEVVEDDRRLRPEASEVDRLCADASLLAGLTGWRGAVPFRDGLARTYDWVARNLHRFDLGRYAI